jgi:hypothetical protein
MTFFNLICPDCGAMIAVLGGNESRVCTHYHCPACECLFKTVVAALHEDLHDPEQFYTTICVKEGVLNKKGKG